MIREELSPINHNFAAHQNMLLVDVVEQFRRDFIVKLPLSLIYFFPMLHFYTRCKYSIFRGVKFSIGKNEKILFDVLSRK